MTENPSSPPDGGHTYTSSPGMHEELRMLRRSRTDRVVAGVLGGLGRRLGIDPVILRVVTAVLVLFGGAGVLFYAAAWLLLPAEDEPASILDQAIGRREVRDTSAIPLALALGSVTLISSGIVISSAPFGPVLLILAAIGVYTLLKRGAEEPEAEHPPRMPSDVPYVYDAATGTGGWTPPHAAGYAPPNVADPDAGVPSRSTAGASAPETPESTTPVDDATAPDAAVASDLGPVPSTSGSVSQGWPEGPDWGAGDASSSSRYSDLYYLQDQPPEPVAPPAAEPVVKERSVLGFLTFCAALISVGGVALSSVIFGLSPGPMYVAVPLAVVGLGLLVGTWYGRSRGLIWLGILLTLALIPASLANQWSLATGPVELVASADLAALPATNVEHGAGPVDYDLSELELDDGDVVSITVQLGVGPVGVIVPPEADVVVTSSLGLGAQDIFDTSTSGFGRTETYTDFGPDGVGGGQIELTLEVGVGNIEVTRAELEPAP
ncbi:PspC domain-containing protein [Phytoactinopolyspora mesophila]|nr:PspC domain-containing protein [Phytoactinopolyspora mesophila]